jgi:hypothetical protein
MVLIAWPLTDMRAAISSTMTITQLTDAATATGSASLRAIPRDRFHRVSHKNMYETAKPTPAQSTTSETVLNRSWLAVRVGHHAAAVKPFHCGTDTAIRRNSPARKKPSITVKNRLLARRSRGELR